MQTSAVFSYAAVGNLRDVGPDYQRKWLVARAARSIAGGCSSHLCPKGQKPEPKRKKAAPKQDRSRIQSIPAAEPAARDEEPRLILPTDKDQPPGIGHYLGLADVALGRMRKPSQRG